MKKLFRYLVPILQVVQGFFYPILEIVKRISILIGLPQTEGTSSVIANMLFGFFPLLLLFAPLVKWFGDGGIIIGSYLILYGVYRVLFTLSYVSYAYFK